MSENRKLTLSEIMARPMPEPDPETEAELAALEELFDPPKDQQQQESQFFKDADSKPKR